MIFIIIAKCNTFINAVHLDVDYYVNTESINAYQFVN